jgi:hypothetical protein
VSSSEKQLGIIKDIFLSVDAGTRYDVYFTDRRIAIVCMGKASHFESQGAEPITFLPSSFGVPAPVDSYVEKVPDRQAVEEEIKNWSINDLLKLSKKSCFYTYEEIEEVRLLLGHKPKFIILSKDCESKFSPNEEQIRQICEIMPTIESLKNKFSVAGNWNLLQEIFKASICNQSSTITGES